MRIEKTPCLMIENELFPGFAKWLVVECDFTAIALCRVIENPWNYTEQFNEYIDRLNEVIERAGS